MSECQSKVLSGGLVLSGMLHSASSRGFKWGSGFK